MGTDGSSSEDVAAAHSMQHDRHLFSGALIRQVQFGGPPIAGARSVLERFVFRERKALRVGFWEFCLAHPWNAGLMNVINYTGRGDWKFMVRFDPMTLRVDHYVDLFRTRCEACELRDEAK